MPDVVIHTIDSSSGASADYSTVHAWNTAQGRDLTDAGIDDIAIGILRAADGSANTTTNWISGWTTDETRWCMLFVDPKYRHDGRWNTAKFRMARTATGSYDCNIRCESLVGKMYFIGFQFEITAASQSYGGCFYHNSIDGYPIFEDCIFKGVLSGTTDECGALRTKYIGGGDVAGAEFYNCVFQDFVNSGYSNIADIDAWRHNYIYEYHGTHYNCYMAAKQDSASEVRVYNSIYDSNGISGGNSGWGSIIDHAYCISDVSGLSGTGDQTGVVNFRDEANDDFRLVNAAANTANPKGQGYPYLDNVNRPYSHDIIGTRRFKGNVDIGAYQIPRSDIDQRKDLYRGYPNRLFLRVLDIVKSPEDWSEWWRLAYVEEAPSDINIYAHHHLHMMKKRA